MLATTKVLNNRLVLLILGLVLYPLGSYLVWKKPMKTWKKTLYLVVGLPLFLVLVLYFGILLFASLIAST